MLSVFACGGIALVSILMPLSKNILMLLGLTEGMVESGIGYFRIQLVSIGVSMFNTVFLGLEKARGATVNILFVNIMSMSLKLVFTVVFVTLLNLGTDMVAFSTLLADISVTCYAAAMLIRKNIFFTIPLKIPDLKRTLFLPYARFPYPYFWGNLCFPWERL